MAECPRERRKPFCNVIDGVPRCVYTVPARVKQALEFVPQKGDLLQVSYPKSGTHWVQYIMQLILKEGGSVDSYEEFMGSLVFIEYFEVHWEHHLAPGTYRLFLTHLPLRRDKFNPEAKYVYVARNPWDVCVSFYYHIRSLSFWQFEDGSFDDFLEAFIEGNFGYGDYFEHVVSGYNLRNEPNVLFLTYEELKRDTPGTVIRLARFLGERYSKKLEEDGETGRKRLELILERSKAENMRKVLVLDVANTGKEDLRARLAELNATVNADLAQDSTQFKFVRKGEIGSWKELFNRDQLRRMEAAIVEKTRGSGVMELWADIRQEALRFMEELRD